MRITEEIFKLSEKTVAKLCKKFSYSTGIEEEELVADCWAHICYAIQFYDQEKKSLNSFIYMSAHNEIMNQIYKRNRKIEGNLHKINLGLTLTEDMGEEEENNIYYMLASALSSQDEYFMLNTFLFAPQEVQELAKAILDEDLQSINAIKTWCAMKGWPHKKITSTLNSLKRYMTCM